MPNPSDLPDRILARTEKSGDCLLWTGKLTPRGYGPHRAAYKAAGGKVARNQPLDHLCNQPRCVNPAHLQPTTARTNAHRKALTKATGVTSLERVRGGKRITFNTTGITLRCRHCGGMNRVAVALIEGRRKPNEGEA